MRRIKAYNKFTLMSFQGTEGGFCILVKIRRYIQKFPDWK
jgi:hypothetical protein